MASIDMWTPSGVFSWLTYLPGGEIELLDMPAGGIALDGAVRGPVLGTRANGDRWSFDHHDRCERLITLATCQQVYTALAMGFKTYHRHVFVNDLDADTIMSLYLVHRDLYGSRVQVDENLVRRAVMAVGIIDSHGPAGSRMLSPEDSAMAETVFKDVLAPVTELRGRVREKFEQWDTLFETCVVNLIRWFEDGAPVRTTQQPPVADLSIKEEVNIGPHKVCMFTSESWGFGAVYDLGYSAGIAYKDAPYGTRSYTIGKMNDLVPLDIPRCMAALNVAELRARVITDPNVKGGWGGGSSIGGSPRLPGGESSVLLPQDVWKLVTGLWRIQ